MVCAVAVFVSTHLTIYHADVFKKYKDATGAVDDEDTGLLKVTQAQYKKMKSLIFTIGGVCAVANLSKR